jgi:signal transduction histidine kinase
MTPAGTGPAARRLRQAAAALAGRVHLPAGLRPALRLGRAGGAALVGWVHLPAGLRPALRRGWAAGAALTGWLRLPGWLGFLSARALLPVWSWFLLAVVVASLVTLGWLTFRSERLVDESVRLQEDQIAAWEVANVQRQLLHVESAVAAANGRGKVRDPAALRKLMAQAVAAAAALQHGPSERGLHRVMDWEPLLRRIRNLLGRLEMELEPFVTHPADRGPLLLTGLHEVSRLTEELSTQAYTSNTRQAKETTARLSQVQRYLAAVQVLLVLLLGALMLAVWFSLRARLQAAYLQIARQRAVEGELRQAKDAAEEASRIKSQFLASMSHELRTPLTAMLGFCQLVLRGAYGKTSQRVHEATEKVLHNGQLLLHLLNDVLDLSRIEADRMTLDLQPQDPATCIADAVERMEPLAREKGLELLAEPCGALAPCRLDRRRITQVLLNLIANAIKFTERGRVRVGIEPHDGELRFFVADTGAGIPPERIDTLFIEFQHRDAHIAREAPGAGLGLAISRRLVQLHKGRIWVDSALGEGSTFWFCLPAGEDHGQEQQDKEAADPGGRGQRIAGPGDADVPGVPGV